MKVIGVYIAFALCIENVVGIENIDFLDTKSVIVRRSPNPQNGGLFGYSAVLHKISTDGDTYNNMRLMVGAPKFPHQSNGGVVEPTGTIFSCLLTSDTCDVLNISSFYTFDDDIYSINTNKSQLLGVSLYSNGNNFVACAPRLRTNFGSIEMERDLGGQKPTELFFENMPGRCFIGDRSLQSFEQHSYCFNNTIIGTYGSCNIGLSLTGPQPETDDDIVVFGLPTSNDIVHYGSFLYTTVHGTSIVNERISRNFAAVNPACAEGSESGAFAYDGFAVAVGYITNATKLDVITAQPRYVIEYVPVSTMLLPMAIGLVRVASEYISSCPRYRYTSYLYGHQPNEYFGFSLVALDLTGDGYDELLVGAPLYYSNTTSGCVDCGRVYVYRNNDTRNLEFDKYLLGEIPFGRFGYAMTAVGDINYDGCDDFVVSSPLSLDGGRSGTIYLYLGGGPSLLVVDQYVQKIVGNELNGLASVFSFGMSLSSGYDVDDNGYNDLVIGAGFNETVVVLRTRPIFEVQFNMTVTSSVINFTETNCALSGGSSNDGICFDITFQIRDTKKNLTTSYDLLYILTADFGEPLPVLFFDSLLQHSVINGSITFSPSEMTHMITHTIYAKPNNTVVSRNALIELDFRPIDNRSLDVVESLKPTVVADLSSISSLQIFINGSSGCFASSICQTDLQLRSFATQELTILADVTQTIVIPIEIINDGDNVSCVQVFYTPAEELQLNSVVVQNSQQTVPQQVECVDLVCALDGIDDNQARMVFRFSVSSLELPNDSVSVLFNASSGCSEINQTNNVELVEIPIRRETDLSTRISVLPSQLSFQPVSPNKVVVNQSLDLGPHLTVTVTVRNSGPSNSLFSTLTILWPLHDPDENEQFFLYPTGIMPPSSVSCDMGSIDIANLNKARRRRQSGNPPPSEDLISTETWNCTGAQRDDCTPIRCNITNLDVDRSVRITITSRVDLRTLSRRGMSSQWKLEMQAMVSSAVSQGNNAEPDIATGFITLIPNRVIALPPDEEDDNIPIWVIILAAVVTLAVIIVISIVLYCFGFCQRKKKDQELEEEQKWVSASGTVTPADLSRENSMRVKTITDEHRSSDINQVNDDDEKINTEVIADESKDNTGTTVDLVCEETDL